MNENKVDLLRGRNSMGKGTGGVRMCNILENSSSKNCSSDIYINDIYM